MMINTNKPESILENEMNKILWDSEITWSWQEHKT